MFQKKLLISAFLSLGAATVGTSVFAYDFIQDAGPYIGVQGGFSRADYKDLDDDTKNVVEQSPNHSTSQGGFGGRLYAGWQFNPFLSVEGGYNQIADNKYSADGIFLNENGDILANPHFKFKTNAWDLVGKLSLPLNTLNPAMGGFSLYGKAGAAYVTSKAEITVNNVTGSSTAHAWRPTYGVGAAYNFNTNLALDVGYTRIEGHNLKDSDYKDGDSYKSTPNVNMATIGISYKFDLINPSDTTASASY